MEERQRSPPTIPKIPAGAAKIPAEATSSTVEDLVELPSPESLSRMKEVMGYQDGNDHWAWH
ncbi:hypothetical protein HanPSC8_Chr05g0192041 [Helianthus annuus]|nr:hypothetical protein HanPSC8_Chr05g0192041 [Helianthus annuus]